MMGDYRVRNNIGFWLLGLCNNYAYVVMLTAAVDLLDKHFNDDTLQKDKHLEIHTDEKDICNPVSTGAVLIANIIPALIVKIFSPFIITNTRLRVSIVVILAALSFLVTSYSRHSAMTYFGIVCASLSSGLGEVTFLSYTSNFNPTIVSSWSSGTGAAGLLGSISYSGFRQMGVTPRTALLLMLFVPFMMFISYAYIIRTPKSKSEDIPIQIEVNDPANLTTSINNENLYDAESTVITDMLTFRSKLVLIKPLLKFMIPLGLVYYFEYLINQGLFEVIYFPNTFLKNKEQYYWYQVIYQLGVLISRSSLHVIYIEKLWLLPILQCAVFIILLLQVIYNYIGELVFVFIIILFEGLLGGAAYVNTFYKISLSVIPDHKQFSLGFASLSDSLGITLAGFTAIALHNSLCEIVNKRYQ